LAVVTTLAVAMLVIGAASTQNPEDELRSKVASIRYLPLAEQARIQGDVHLEIKSGVVKILPGHPLLSQNASESAQDFESLLPGRDLDVTFILYLPHPSR
jgi:hypothetical protein